ncbi:MAG: ACT domain-containing protein [Candidatus Brocadiia bacterium]
MFVKQLSVFIENRSGRLAAATRALADEDINILALSLADTADFGILRLIVDDPEAGHTALKHGGFTVIANNVLAVEVEDKPGGLATILDALEEEEINVEYMYAFSSIRTKRAALIFRFEDPQAAVESLNKAGFSVMSKVDVLGE